MNGQGVDIIGKPQNAATGIRAFNLSLARTTVTIPIYTTLSSSLLRARACGTTLGGVK